MQYMHQEPHIRWGIDQFPCRYPLRQQELKSQAARFAETAMPLYAQAAAEFLQFRFQSISLPFLSWNMWELSHFQMCFQLKPQSMGDVLGCIFLRSALTCSSG